MLQLANSKDLLLREITQKWYGLIDVFTNSNLGLTSCKPSLDALLTHSQRIMPRYYTIASSNKAHPDKIRIAISLT